MSNHYYSEGSRDDKINRLEDVTNDLFNDDTSGINDILSIIVKGIIPSFLRILKECIDHHNHLNDGIADTGSSAIGGIRNYSNGKMKKKSSKLSSYVSSSSWSNHDSNYLMNVKGCNDENKDDKCAITPSSRYNSEINSEINLSYSCH